MLREGDVDDSIGVDILPPLRNVGDSESADTDADSFLLLAAVGRMKLSVELAVERRVAEVAFGSAREFILPGVDVVLTVVAEEENGLAPPPPPPERSWIETLEEEYKIQLTEILVEVELKSINEMDMRCKV
jgi:hypothetical protein